MKSLIIIFMLVAPNLSHAADDLLNCRLEDGTEMSETACETDRSLLSKEEQESIQSELTRRAEEQAARKQKECSSRKQRNLTGKEKSLVSRAIKDLLKDPDSAKFKWMKMIEGDALNAYCGLVNARNSYGGYTGYTPFYITIRKSEAKLAMISDRDDDDLAVKWCSDACYEDFSRAK